MDAVVKRDRLIISTVVVSATFAIWFYLAGIPSDLNAHGITAMATPQWHQWTTAEATTLFVMWTVMMVGMMLPTALPMIVAFATTLRRHRDRQTPYLATTLFVLGYVILWAGFSGGAAVVQAALHNAALLNTAMAVSNAWLGGILLIATGIFQWSGFKQRCLAYCRSPLSFLMTQWRDGLSGAFVMGLKHGAYCVGCCWLIMALLFVVGVMNLLWGALITAFVIAEKVAPAGDRIAKIAGFGFVAIGVIVIWHG